MKRPTILLALSLAIGIFLFQGAIEVSAKKPIKTRTETLSIPASAFIAQEETIQYFNNGLVLAALDASGTFVAPLLLPDGAIIDQVTLNGYDDTTDGHIEMHLMVYNLNDISQFGTYGRIALLNSQDYPDEAPGNFSLSLDPDSQINNAEYAYGLQVYIINGGDSYAVRFFRAMIEYSVGE